MPQFSKSAWIAVVAAVIVLTGGFLWWSEQRPPALMPLVAPGPGDTGAAAPVHESARAAPDTSDASLNQDLSNIDSQMNGLSSDTQSVDQSMNDQPIPQGQ